MFTIITNILIVLIGIMMATVYKRSVSSISGLQIDPIAVRKLYWCVAGVLIVLCAFLSYKAISSFHEDGIAEEQMQRSQDYESMMIFFLNIGFMVLIVLSNVYSMRAMEVRISMYVFTFLIYAGFVVLDDFLLEDALFQFKKINQLWEGDFNFSSLKGYLTLIFCAVLCAFNALMTYWGIKDKVQHFLDDNT